ncbi:MAG: SIR2 family protein [Planctomycetota bacterium]|nr:SIR2 family protein [Planctomycetota bacterium]MDA0921318.1 SIR2 family protein [Planctomycetota bacterium]
MAPASISAGSPQALSAMESIENLVDRIGKGEVVFFVGAGFSLDSEGNSATRLMTRLLWRLQAMSVVLESTIEKLLSDDEQSDHQKTGTETADLAARRALIESLLRSMKRTFKLKFNFAFAAEDPRRHEFWWPFNDIRKVAEKYYESNDWFCATFEKLLEIGYSVCQIAGADVVERSAKLESMISEIAFVERRIRKRQRLPDGKEDPHGELEIVDSVPLCRVVPCLFAWASSRSTDRSRDAGKALFLDTMGFADEAIMGGNFRQKDLRSVEDSFRQRLFPRHHVLARLAREGLCPVVLTTNYDLLLEGAWRMSGFELEADRDRSSQRSPFHTMMPPAPLREMAVVSSPVEFVECGKANRTSLVVKVHGCVGNYRRSSYELRTQQSQRASLFFDDDANEMTRRLRSVAEWEANLQSMVFTYREIQNWREDSWARDFLATTQRTRSVAFVGYSLQDPVIHDAFRTVYEEMAVDQKRAMDSKAEANRESSQNRESGSPPTVAKRPQRDASAFFFGSAGEQSFHATEVLHAATWAAGSESSSPHEHTNYLRFSYLHEDYQFPNLDDLFLWTYHRTMRQRQLQMLQDELRPIAATLLRGSNVVPLPSTMKQIEDRFRRVMQLEYQIAENWFGDDVGALPDGLTDEEKLREKQERRERCSRHRRQLQHLVAWTWFFQPALMKEFACADIRNRRGVAVPVVSSLRNSDWYHPAAAAPGHVAWGVVLELAIRWLLGSTAGLSSDECLGGCGEFGPLPGSVPEVSFFDHRRPTLGEPGRGALPDGLRIISDGMSRRSCLSNRRKCGVWHEWQLPTDGRLWQNREAVRFDPAMLRKDQSSERRHSSSRQDRVSRTDVPAAVNIWQWALGDDPKPSTPIRRID